MKNLQFLIITTLILFLSLITQKTHAQAAIKTPKTPTVTCVGSHSLKLHWKKVKGASGYRIYRYSKKKKKYVAVKTIKKKNTQNWVNKKLKKNKIYKYKVAAYKKTKKKKKKFSKRSYVIWAMTYGKKSLKINVGDVVADFKSDEHELSICSQDKLYTYFAEDFYRKTKEMDITNTVYVSEKVVWSSSDTSIASVDQEGNVTTYTKTGKCKIKMRAHNGVIGTFDLEVKNYARPDSFPGYYGDVPSISLLLRKDKSEVCNIGEFFKIKDTEKKYGTVSVDDEGNITGIPQIKDISQIENDFKKLMNEYAYPLSIYYERGYVKFMIGNVYTYVTYNTRNMYRDDVNCIAPHWLSDSFEGA